MKCLNCFAQSNCSPKKYCSILLCQYRNKCHGAKLLVHFVFSDSNWIFIVFLVFFFSFSSSLFTITSFYLHANRWMRVLIWLNGKFFDCIYFYSQTFIKEPKEEKKQASQIHRKCRFCFGYLFQFSEHFVSQFWTHIDISSLCLSCILFFFCMNTLCSRIRSYHRVWISSDAHSRLVIRVLSHSQLALWLCNVNCAYTSQDIA